MGREPRLSRTFVDRRRNVVKSEREEVTFGVMEAAFCSYELVENELFV